MELATHASTLTTLDQPTLKLKRTSLLTPSALNETGSSTVALQRKELTQLTHGCRLPHVWLYDPYTNSPVSLTCLYGHVFDSCATERPSQDDPKKKATVKEMDMETSTTETVAGLTARLALLPLWHPTSSRVTSTSTGVMVHPPLGRSGSIPDQDHRTLEHGVRERPIGLSPSLPLLHQEGRHHAIQNRWPHMRHFYSASTASTLPPHWGSVLSQDAWWWIRPDGILVQDTERRD